MTFKLLLIVMCLAATFSNSISQQTQKLFRKDYTYLPETDSFYKIHTIHKNWKDAKKRCALEGANLFYPNDQIETDAVLAFWNRTQPFYWVYVGISDLIAKGVFETVDGLPINEVYDKWGPGEPNDANGVEDCVILRKHDATLNDDRCDKNYPFICKKTFGSLKWNNDCDMPEMGFVYNADLGKCYKFHANPMNWTEAYSVCNTELSYLTVIDSQKEADYLVKMTESASKGSNGQTLNGVVYLGFHNRDGEGWRTIKGTTIESSGYKNWGYGQPDGGATETCGTMFFNGQLNDLECLHKIFFICEHDISGVYNVDDRFSS